MSRQVSVPLDSALIQFVDRAAERDSRTVAGQIRHYIVQAMRHAGNPTVRLEPWPPSLTVVSRQNLADVKAEVLEMEAERDKLAAAEKKNHLGLMPHDEVRLRYLRDIVMTRRSQISAIERLTRGNNYGEATGRGRAYPLSHEVFPAEFVTAASKPE